MLACVLSSVILVELPGQRQINEIGSKRLRTAYFVDRQSHHPSNSLPCLLACPTSQPLN